MDVNRAEKISLLLVEDDEDFSLSLKTRLNKKGLKVTAVPTAEDALKILDGAEFDVIVSDINLPGMDGLRFLDEIRGRDHDIPVILVTGDASLESAKSAVRLKAFDYLLKPLDGLDDLLTPLNKAV